MFYKIRLIHNSKILKYITYGILLELVLLEIEDVRRGVTTNHVYHFKK